MKEQITRRPSTAGSRTSDSNGREAIKTNQDRVGDRVDDALRTIVPSEINRE